LTLGIKQLGVRLPFQVLEFCNAFQDPAAISTALAVTDRGAAYARARHEEAIKAARADSASLKCAN
jgi:hypothetical protein